MMTPERWQQVQGLFLEAVECAPEERSAFLSKACDDSDLRANVEALLAADAAPPSIFDVTPEQTQTLHSKSGIRPGGLSEEWHSSNFHLSRRIGLLRKSDGQAYAHGWHSGLLTIVPPGLPAGNPVLPYYLFNQSHLVVSLPSSRKVSRVETTE